MASQKDISLYSGDATPKDIVLRDLPAAPAAAVTTIYLNSGDATAKDVVLRDPTVQSASGSTIDCTQSSSQAQTTAGTLEQATEVDCTIASSQAQGAEGTFARAINIAVVASQAQSAAATSERTLDCVCHSAQGQSANLILERTIDSIIVSANGQTAAALTFVDEEPLAGGSGGEYYDRVRSHEEYLHRLLDSTKAEEKERIRIRRAEEEELIMSIVQFVIAETT